MAPLEPARSTFSYRASLDGLRGLSIIAVMAFHSGIISGGYIGVDVFFALSGFLITTLLLDEWRQHGRISIARFYLRRGLRLLPALLVLVLICAPATAALAPIEKSRHVWQASAFVLFYVANWALIFGTPLYVLNHSWSLSIEEQFYLLWPLALNRVLRLEGRLLSISVVAVFSFPILIPVYRFLLEGHGASLAHLYLGSDTKADSILAGCALALLKGRAETPLTSRGVLAVRIAAAAGVLTLGCLFFFAAWPTAFLRYSASTLAALAAAAIIAELMLVKSHLDRFLANSMLVKTGRLSYSLYLWHFPIFFVLGALSTDGSSRDAARVLSAWILTFIVASGSYRLVEQPFLELKTRFVRAPGSMRRQMASVR